jgi:hypothetical protein
MKMNRSNASKKTHQHAAQLDHPVKSNDCNNFIFRPANFQRPVLDGADANNQTLPQCT